MANNHDSPSDQAAAALDCVSPDLPREEWVRVGMALKSELGDSEGFALFDAWSRNGQSYDEHAARDTWKSIKSGGGVTIKTLFRMAIDAGWKPPQSQQPDPQKAERAKRAELRRQRDWASAAGNARALYELAKPCQAHPYLKKKGVAPVEGLRTLDATEAIRPGCSFGPDIGQDAGRLLIVPILDDDGQVQSLEAITADGVKGFFAGAKKAGGLFAISGQEPIDDLFLVEGLATGLTVHQATGARVHVAFDAGNLKAVAETTHHLFPAARLVIAGDLDENNAGQKAARSAARAVNGRAIFPDFSTVEGREHGDWNDLHAAAGIEIVSAQIAAVLAESPAEPETPPEPKPDPEPRGFRIDGPRVVWINKDGFPVPICGALKVLARVRNDSDAGYGLWVQFKALAGHTKELVVLESDLETPQELRKKLSDAGLWLNRDPAIKGRLIQYLAQAEPKAMAMSTNRPGWSAAGDFVFPGGEIIRAGTAGPALVWVGDPPDPNRHGQRGTLEEWQAHQGKYCIGNPVLQFMAIIAFGAKILHFVAGEGGMFNVWGQEGSGKTSGQRLQVSASAPPGARSSWEGSYVSYGQRWAELNDADGAMDEMKLAREDDLVKVVYMVSNGHDKGRSKEGLGLAREKTWRVLVSSTGEMPMTGYLKDSGHRLYAGQEVRCIDLRVDQRRHGVFDELHGFAGGAELAEEIERCCALYYGAAIREFVTRLMAAYPPERIRAFVADIRKDFELQQIPKNSDPAIHCAAKRFAFMAAGGELAIELGILPWRKWDALKAAGDMFNLWIHGRGGVGNRDRIELLKQIRHYLLTHEEDQFQRNCPKCAGSGKPGYVKVGFNAVTEEADLAICSACQGTSVLLNKTLNKSGWLKLRRGEDGDTMKLFHIYPETFEREICRGHDFRTALELLKSLKILEADGKRGLFKTKARPLHGLGTPFEQPMDVYVINLHAPGWSLADVQEDSHEAA